MYILGISAFYHDSAACLIFNGEVIAAAQEERFSRIKNDSKFPFKSVEYCLNFAQISIDDIDAAVFYDKPFLKFERILESYLHYVPKGLFSFLKAMPVWLSSKLNTKSLILNELKNIESFDKSKLNILFSEHHLSHAASAYYPSRFRNAAILTIDGVGEWTTTGIFHGVDEKITSLKEIHFPHSLGLLYSAFTYFLGFKINSGEYKLMGLAPYGNINDEQTQKFIQIIKSKLISIKDDGSFRLNDNYFKYAYSLRTISDRKWENLFGISKLNPDSIPSKAHCNLALAIQTVTEEVVIKLAREAKRITGSDYLCMSGGVALNCVANGKLLKENLFKEIYVQPASGDAGGALGAALSAYYLHFENKIQNNIGDFINGTFLGPHYSQKEVLKLSHKFKAVSKIFENEDELLITVAKLIHSGNVVGWFQGRMEFGPRALGNRSILADVSDVEMQSKLNLKIKFREGFRPFAPSICEEDLFEYFDISQNSPYMILIAWVKDKFRKLLPDNYSALNPIEQLKYIRSDFQAITHIDFSARVHSVSKQTNPKYWKLLQEIKKNKGVSMCVNTSFNVRGEPIVCTPEDAYRCFMQTEMDALVIENQLFLKSEQLYASEFNWNRKFKKD